MRLIGGKRMNDLQKQSIANNRELTRLRRERRTLTDKKEIEMMDEKINHLKAVIKNYGREPLQTKPFPKKETLV